MLNRFGMLVGMALFASAVLAEDGRVVALQGDVSAMRSGRTVRLENGSPVFAGDRITLGANALAQIQMKDRSVLALKEKTEFEISQYAFNPDKPNEGKGLFNLVKGGLRVLTGLIGVHARDHFQVATPTATIGIRGTHFRLQQCADNSCSEGGKGARDGLYGGVTEGRINIANDASGQDFGVDDFFYVADKRSAPERLLTPPAFLVERQALTSQRRRADALASTTARVTPPSAASVAAMASSPTAAVQINNLVQSQYRPVEGITPSNLPTTHFVPIGGAGDIRGQIVWMTNADIDLHLLVPGGHGEVSFSNKVVYIGTTAKAVLDADNTGGFINIAPDKRVENIQVNGTNIPTGDYKFFVNNYAGNNDAKPTTVQVRVTGDGGRTSMVNSVTLSNLQSSNYQVVTYGGPGAAAGYTTRPR